MPVSIPKFKKSNKQKLVDLINQAKGVNGMRALIRQYTTPQFRHQLVLHSPEFFLTYYLGFRLPPHQKKWLELWSVKYLLELAPRDHGKSWIFSYGQPLYRIYENLIQNRLESVTYRFLQISKTDEMAGKYSEQVKTTIEENPFLMEDFGDIRDTGRWLKTFWSCKRKIYDSVEKDHTYEKVGVLGGITGGHFEEINLDDPLDDENTKTVDRMQTIDNWFWGTVWNLREPPTKFRVTGTRKNRRDLYHKLLQTKTWRHNVECAIIKYPMIPDPKDSSKEIDGWVYVTDTGRYVRGIQELRTEEQIKSVQLLTDDYEVLWPSTEKVDNDGNPVVDPETGKPIPFGWGIEELLMDRVTQGPTSFAREKQNQISEGEGAIFHANWLFFFDNEQLWQNEQDGYYYLLPEVKREAA
jgi:hypothetical protein